MPLLLILLGKMSVALDIEEDAPLPENETNNQNKGNTHFDHRGGR